MWEGQRIIRGAGVRGGRLVGADGLVAARTGSGQWARGGASVKALGCLVHDTLEGFESEHLVLGGGGGVEG